MGQQEQFRKAVPLPVLSQVRFRMTKQVKNQELVEDSVEIPLSALKIGVLVLLNALIQTDNHYSNRRTVQRILQGMKNLRRLPKKVTAHCQVFLQ